VPQSPVEVRAQPTIALVVPWYGPLPPTFDPWLRSCAGNPTIDWLLFTDEDLSRHAVPANVRTFQMSFANLRDLFRRRLDLEVCLQRPYQLCNFKIAYGWLFEDWLSDYEIWGYCDVDVVWGDLRSFFPGSVLRAFPKAQQHGHLTFYHNTDSVNQLFRQAHPEVDYRVVFTQPEVRGFDEWRGAHELAYLAGLEQYWMRQFIDVDVDAYALRGGRLRNRSRQLFYWEDGALYREYVVEAGIDVEDMRDPIVEQIRRDEFAYIHLQKRHMRAPEFDASTVRGFYITPDGFVQKVKAEHCLDDFDLFNPKRPASGSVRSRARWDGALRPRLVRALKRLRG